MKLSVTIPDELYETLREACGAKGASAPACVAKRIAKLAATYGAHGPERVLVVDPEARRALEAIAQTTIADGVELVALLTRMNVIKLGTIEWALNDEDVARLTEMASFWGESPQEFIKRTLTEQVQQTLGTF